MNGEVHGETVAQNNVKRCLHKWILISIAIEAAMLGDSMTARENALLWGLLSTVYFHVSEQMSQDFAEMQEDDDEGGLIIDTDLIAGAIQSAGDHKGFSSSGNDDHHSSYFY